MKKRYKRKIQNKDSFLIWLVLTALLVFYYTRSIPIDVSAIVGISLLKMGIPYFNKKKKEESLKRSGITEIDHMDGVQFRYFLAALFKHIGYKVKTTQASSDYGADILIVKEDKKIVIQAKRYLKKVGIKAVQEITAAKSHYEANNAWVVTNSFFTNRAIELAKSNGVRLLIEENL